jgi:hypothetical protein
MENMIHISNKRCLASAFAFAMLFATGCGGDVAHVSGRVSRADDAPLAGARVVARSDATGKSAEGLTDVDGRYALSTAELAEGMPAGEYKVTILESRGRADNMRPATIASKYGNGDQSGLTFVVVGGESKTFDIVVDPP